ncbi:SH3-like domain-containing protein [Nitrobacteraceae bacterium AZCC 2146]
MEPLIVAGIDDWAFRKNHRYGTIVCDFERRRIVTLLPDREIATVRTWLSDHPEIRVVSRDRGGGYGEAVAKALPDAIQVADRWHLMENASAAFLNAVPRYVSLKSDHVNVRAGPTKDNDVAWVYTKSGLPVEITAEYENWRRVRDSEGAEGWVYHSLLSGRRTAVVTMKTKDDLASIYDSPDSKIAVAARLQAGVVAQVKRCSNGWCRVIGTGFDGWIEQQRLWGVYADEKVD